MPPEADPGTPDGGVAAVTPVAPATPAVAAEAPAPTPEAEVDPFDQSADSFDRAYVTKIREEAKARRLALEPYEKTFEPYSEQERATWFHLINEMAADPRVGTQKLAELVKAMEETFAEEDAKNAPAQAEGEKPLTKKELDAYMAEQRKELEISAAAAQIEVQAKAAGYEPGTTKYKLLLARAMDMNYDLDAAIKAEAAEKQADFDARVAAKIASGEKWPITPTPSGSGSPSGEVQHDGSWSRASEGARKRFGAKVGT